MKTTLKHWYLNSSGGASYDAAYQAVLDRATTLGFTHPGATFKNAQNQFVVDLKAASVWDKIKYLLVLANDGSANFGLLNWKAPSSFQAVPTNSPTWVSGTGYDFNGTDNYIIANAIITTDLGMGQGDAHMGVYCYENAASGTVVCGCGFALPTNAIFINPRNATDNFTSACNDSTSNALANSNSIGYFAVSRTGATEYRKYINGAETVVSVASTGITALKPFIGAFNANGTPSSFTPRGVSMFHCGTYLTTPEVAAIDSAWDTFKAAVGL